VHRQRVRRVSATLPRRGRRRPVVGWWRRAVEQGARRDRGSVRFERRAWAGCGLALRARALDGRGWRITRCRVGRQRARRGPRAEASVLACVRRAASFWVMLALTTEGRGQDPWEAGVSQIDVGSQSSPRRPGRHSWPRRRVEASLFALWERGVRRLACAGAGCALLGGSWAGGTSNWLGRLAFWLPLSGLGGWDRRFPGAGTLGGPLACELAASRRCATSAGASRWCMQAVAALVGGLRCGCGGRAAGGASVGSCVRSGLSSAWGCEFARCVFVRRHSTVSGRVSGVRRFAAASRAGASRLAVAAAPEVPVA